MILNIPEACSDIELLNILSIFKGLLNLVTIIVPVILIVLLMIDIVKTVASAEVDTKKLFKTISKRLAAAVVIFLIPYIISFVIGLVPNGTADWANCYKYAEKSKVREISVDNAIKELEELDDAIDNFKANKTSENEGLVNVAYEEARKAVKLITDKEIRKQYQETLQSKKEIIERLSNTGSSGGGTNMGGMGF